MLRFWGFILALVLQVGMVDRLRAQGGYMDTTEGAADKEAQGKLSGGLKKEEIDRMTKEQQAMYKRLKDGRYPTSTSSKSRYSTKLEIHDLNGDGITDHDGAANGLEGPMDKVAIGSSGTGGQARQDALQQNTDPTRAPNYKAPTNQSAAQQLANKKVNISPILLDKGGAHGAGPHRIYELKAEAIKASTDAGTAYGKEAVREATAKFEDGVKDSNGGSVEFAKEGEKVLVDVDLARSEFAFLEEVKDKQIKQQKRGIIVDRLAGLEAVQGRKLGKVNYNDSNNTLANGKPNLQFRQMIANGASNAEIAQRIAEQDIIGTKDVCGSPSRPEICDPNNNRHKTQIADSQTHSDLKNKGKNFDPNLIIKNVSEYAAQNSTGGSGAASNIESLYNQGRAQLSAQEKTEIAKNKSKIDACISSDAWCYDRKHAQDAASAAAEGAAPNSQPPSADKFLYEKYTGSDPGGVYDDTREAIYRNLDRARSGALGSSAGGANSFEKNFGSNIDFTSKTDGQTASRPYTSMMDEVAKARKLAKEFQANEAAADERARELGIKITGSKFLDPAYFNPDTMNVQQLFGRDPARDGTTLYNYKDSYEYRLGLENQGDAANDNSGAGTNYSDSSAPTSNQTSIGGGY